MNDKEIRKKLHKILTLVTDINGIEPRKRSISGYMPTVFMYFNGHVASLEVELHENGWQPDEDPDKRWNVYLDSEETLNELDNLITELEEFKRGIER